MGARRSSEPGQKIRKWPLSSRITYGAFHLWTNFEALKPFWTCPLPLALNYQQRGFEILLVCCTLYWFIFDKPTICPLLCLLLEGLYITGNIMRSWEFACERWPCLRDHHLIKMGGEAWVECCSEVWYNHSRRERKSAHRLCLLVNHPTKDSA